MTTPAAGTSGEDFPRRFAVDLGVVTLMALIARAAAALYIPSLPVSDFWSYFHRAINLVQRGRYEAIPGVPGAYLSPGYPAFLAVAFRVFGVSVGLCKVLNVGLGALGVLLLGLAGRELFGEEIGLIAALILCLSPRAILMSCLLASENLEAPLMIGFFFVCCRWSEQSRKLWRPLVAGVILGLACLTRSVALILLILWPLGGWIRGFRWKLLLAETAIVGAVGFSILIPWGLWNRRHFGHFTISTTTAGVNLFMGNQAFSTGTWLGDWRTRLDRLHPELAGKNEAEVDRVSGGEARAWIARHPLGFAHLYARKIWLFCAGLDPTNAADFAVFYRNVEPPWPGVDVLPGPHFFKRHPSVVIWPLRLEYWLLVLLALGGLGVALAQIRRRPPARQELASLAVVTTAIAVFPITTCLFVVVDRYRWPMEDFLMLLAAIGFAALVRRELPATLWRRRDRGIEHTDRHHQD